MNQLAAEAARPPASLSRPAISILMVTHNSWPVLPRCLDSIAAQTRTPYEIIVVDNASTDGTPHLIRRDYPLMRVVENRANVGFAAAVNQAAACARGAYLLLLNPDTVILDGAIDRLYAWSTAEEARGLRVGIWAPRTVDLDGKPTQNSQPFYRPYRLFWTEFRKGPLRPLADWILAREKPADRGPADTGTDDLTYDDLTYIDAAYGCALMIAAALYAQIGGLDEQFFMYEEDIDLCLRVKQAGYVTAYAPHATVVHMGGASATGGPEAHSVGRTHVTLRRTRSRLVYATKHLGAGWVILLRVLYGGMGLACLLGSLIPGSAWRNERRRWLGKTYLASAWQVRKPRT
ncbi:MAG: glycosyltransferase family 2 protein [Litorilinea sp.]